MQVFGDTLEHRIKQRRFALFFMQDNQTPYTTLFDVLEQLLIDNAMYLDSAGKVVKNIVLQDALNLKPELLGLLLACPPLRERFFVRVGETWVFDKVEFGNFINLKNFLKDSYTRYKDRIGLGTAGETDDYLNSRKEVVLYFPYKDCVLQGGQTKEDARKNEVFWNVMLAPDQIDRLLDEKVLTKWRRIEAEPIYKATPDLLGEQRLVGYKAVGKPIGELRPDDNFILKGNNLLALHCLRARYEGKVKLIYIDPPYNTGNDSFLYNDKFNHSTWLVFMKNRLEVARKLLANDGSIVISIDSKEFWYLLILLDEIFGIENKKNIITIKRSSVSGAKVINKGVVNVAEYLVIYAKNTQKWNPNRVFRAKERDDRYNSFITNFEEEPEKWRFSSVLEAWANSLKIDKKKLRKYFKDNYKAELEAFFYANADKIFRFVALDNNAVSSEVVKLKEKSRKDNSRVHILEREDKTNYYLFNGQAILFFKDRLVEIDGKKTFAELITDIWDDVLPNDLHNEGGISMKKGKKPEKLLQRILELTTNKGDLVLDFFAGSGTSLAVAHKMGRQYIGIEQMYYAENLPFIRLGNVTTGEQGGISKAVEWKGGGGFVYAELMQCNQKYVDAIQRAQTDAELASLRQKMIGEAFLNHLYQAESTQEMTTMFENLAFSDKQRFLLELLDLNQLYVNRDEAKDASLKVSAEDLKLTEQFYKS